MLTEQTIYSLVTIDTSWLYSATVLSKLITIDDCLSVPIANNNLQDNDLTIYPNPANDYIYCNLASNQNIKNVILIYNSSGQLLKTIDILKQVKIDILNFKNGLYFIKLANNSNQIFKFIKQ